MLRRFHIYLKVDTELIPSHLAVVVRFPEGADTETLGDVEWLAPHGPETLDWLAQKLNPPTYSRVYDLIGRSNGITWMVVGFWDP